MGNGVEDGLEHIVCKHIDDSFVRLAGNSIEDAASILGDLDGLLLRSFWLSRLWSRHSLHFKLSLACFG